MRGDCRGPDEYPTADAEFAEKAEVRREQQRGELLYRETSGAILGAFYAVHSELGFGFLESVYANSLEVLLSRAGLKVERQVPFDVFFHGHQVGSYRADLVVESRVIVEVKTASAITPQHVGQLLNYLKASQVPVGLLLNFGEKPRFKRLVLTRG